MEENLIQINGGLITNVDVSVKKRMYVKMIMFGILLHVAVKMEKYLASIMDDSAMTCDEIIESNAEETKTIPTSLMKRKQPIKRKISIFYLHFY